MLPALRVLFSSSAPPQSLFLFSFFSFSPFCILRREEEKEREGRGWVEEKKFDF